MKKAGIAIGIFLVVLAGALFWLANNMDSLVKNAIEKYGSEMTGVKVQVASVEIKAKEGTGILRGLVVGNPSGFKTPYAFKVGRIKLDLAISSLAKPVVIIKKIAISSPDVIYEMANGTTNIDAIQKHIANYVGSSGGNSGGQKGGKKLIVSELAIRNAKAQATAGFLKGRTVSVTLPDIVLRNIGKAQGGASPGELGQDVVGALKAKLEGAVNFNALAKSVENTLQKAGSAVRGLFGN